MDTGKKFGTYLRGRREKKGWSLRDLRRLSGIPVTTLFQIESGTNPKLCRVVELAAAFGDSVPRFLAPVFTPKPKKSA